MIRLELKVLIKEGLASFRNFWYGIVISESQHPFNSQVLNSFHSFFDVAVFYILMPRIITCRICFLPSFVGFLTDHAIFQT